MTDWLEFILAFVVFLLTHSIPVRPPVKARLKAVIGPHGFSLAYSALSVAVLTWLIIAAGRAPYVEIWPRAEWQTWVPLIGMALAIVIAALAIGRPNPLSFGGGHNEGFDPENAGIIGWTRHPLLVALAIWSGAHLVPNGDLAHVVLFGVFFGFSLLGMKIIDRRNKRLMGADWERLRQTRRAFRPTRNGLIRTAIGLGVFLTLLLLHEPVIGVDPYPLRHWHQIRERSVGWRAQDIVGLFPSAPSRRYEADLTSSICQIFALSVFATP